MKALIFGRAAGVWEELQKARDLGPFDMVIGVGRAGCFYKGELDHWVTWHADLLDMWAKKREKSGFPPAKHYWSGVYKGSKIPRGRQKLPLPVTYVECIGGSSGFLAIQVALAARATKVVLAGIPMDPEREHVDEPGVWKQGLAYRQVWEQAAPSLGRVRSMSGWTADLLGRPTPEWFNGD